MGFALRIIDLCKSFGSNQVLNTFSCELSINNINCLFGPSGRGKTTLLRIILGLEEAESGLLQWSEELMEIKPAAVFQEDRLCMSLSALANCVLVLPRTAEKDARIAKSTAALQSLGLGDCLHSKVSNLSGGQQRRVALARALVSDFNFLVLDEPFKGLDAQCKQDAMEYTRKCCEDKTVVLVTHDISEAKYLGANIIEMP